MKKLLGILAAFGLTASSAVGVVACSKDEDKPAATFATVVDGIKSLSSKIDVVAGKTADDVVAILKADVITQAKVLKYATGVTFDEQKLTLVNTDVMNGTKALADGDIVAANATPITLGVTFKYDNVAAKLKDAAVTVKSASSVVVDGIKQAKYVLPVVKAAKAVDVIKLVTADFLKNSLSTELQGLFDSVKAKDMNILKGTVVLGDNDLTTAGTISATISLTYDAIAVTGVALTINVSELAVTDITTAQSAVGQMVTGLQITSSPSITLANVSGEVSASNNNLLAALKTVITDAALVVVGNLTVSGDIFDVATGGTKLADATTLQNLAADKTVFVEVKGSTDLSGSVRVPVLVKAMPAKVDITTITGVTTTPINIIAVDPTSVKQAELAAINSDNDMMTAIIGAVTGKAASAQASDYTISNNGTDSMDLVSPGKTITITVTSKIDSLVITGAFSFAVTVVAKTV